MNNGIKQKILIILNDPPYGTERAWNALRLAISLASGKGDEVRLFLLGDAVSCAKRGQETPTGYYNLERMLKGASQRKAEIAACGTCLDARGLKDEELVEGVRRSSLDELTSWTQWADKVLVF
ncbi:MAG: DsrE family protein [Chloroflexi bacterium]|nr:DsrE family protein [Chloroflexota bacterium]